MDNFIQFELWRECNNHCKFCYLQEGNLFNSNEEKLNSIKNTKKLIENNLILKNYEGIALIGGEFFQGQLNTDQLKNEFIDLINCICEKLDKNIIKGFWITASLTKPISDEFIGILNKLNNYKNIWITTSYDTIGRFHTKSIEDTWKNNMQFISNTYKNIKKNTTFILTQDLINKYLNNTFSFKDFKQKYNTEIYFKCPDIGQFDNSISDFEKRTGLKNFFPNRKSFISFISSFLEKDKDISLFDKELRADTLYENLGGKELRIYNNRKNNNEDGSKNPKCGHLSLYQRYIDSDACMMCDKEKILKEK